MKSFDTPAKRTMNTKGDAIARVLARGTAPRPFDPAPYRQELVAIIREVERIDLDAVAEPADSPAARHARYEEALNSILRRYPRDGNGFFSRSQLIAGFRALSAAEDFRLSEQQFIERVRMRPVRSLSGVTPLSVFTRPFPCPGTCIYCPDDGRAPKSYLPDEPGVQRAVDNGFDPYLQTYNRLAALDAIGHPTGKVELIVSGGTWSAYPAQYQAGFVSRCLQAMNDFGTGADARDAAPSRTGQLVDNRDPAAVWDLLAPTQRRNEQARCRCVGLTVETRPDAVNEPEIVRLRRLGCTRVQLGCQSLSDEVLRRTRRGHDVDATRRAVHLLRQAGFKILLHHMPNLPGATPDSDTAEIARLFDDPDFRPDELKLYPCVLVAGTGLVDLYRRGQWRPYGSDELQALVERALARIPRYCRVNRVIRDISSKDIVAGNRRGNLRESAARALRSRGVSVREIRTREIRGEAFDPGEIRVRETEYESSIGRELFLEFVTPSDRLLGFLRLALPARPGFLSELSGSALIREVRVYGAAVDPGARESGKPQHQGLGSRLVEMATARARDGGFCDLAVISAVGTRPYYRRLGFRDGDLYQHLVPA
jgi:elongator complex protein 3